MRSFVDIFLRNSNDVILYIFYIWGNRDIERLSFFFFFFLEQKLQVIGPG